MDGSLGWAVGEGDSLLVRRWVIRLGSGGRGQSVGEGMGHWVG